MMSPSCHLLALLLASLGSHAAPLERFHESQYLMGTRFEIVVYATDEAAASQAIQQAFARIAALDAALSDYKPTSVVSQLSAASPTQRRVDADVFEVLARAQHFSRLSDGAFDVTVGPLTKLWRRARRQKQLPDPALLAAARAATGSGFMILDREARSVELTRPEMRLDLGGIAKGYAADAAVATLRSLGVPRVLVNAGGDLVAGDPPPGKPGWRIGVAPLDARQPPSQILLVQNAAVATSGDAWQYLELNGKRYSHIIDPETGLGLTDRSSVSVIAPDGTTADALASALSVMGVARGIPFIESLPDVEAIMVRVENGQAVSHRSSFADQAFDPLPVAAPPASSPPASP